MNSKLLCLPAAFALACIPLICIPGAAQSPVSPSSAAKPKAAATKNYTPPKTPWGDPDLQGEWPAFANIPMQRPASFGTRAYLTDEEFAQRAKTAVKQSEDDNEEFVPKSGTVSVTINPPSYWV